MYYAKKISIYDNRNLTFHILLRSREQSVTNRDIMYEKSLKNIKDIFDNHLS